MNLRKLGLIASLAMLPAVSPALAQERILAIAPERLIQVTGEASVNVKPDFARVSLGVTTAGKDAREALAANSKAVSAVISVIRAEGVAPADLQTSNLSISPQFSNATPPPPGGQAITGYQVNDTVTVTVRDIPSLGPLIDKAVDAGANSIYAIAYGENDPSALLDKVRPLAVADAKRKADIYANAGGAKVARLMTLSENSGVQPVLMGRRAYAQSAAAAPTPIEAGEDKLTVSITAQFELTP
jgi:uncharacterized protein YggE